ncbi:MAG: transposase [Gammaproteobacteria bacterium]
MGHPLRIEYEGAWYHVMNRGAGKKIIFKTREHKQLFLSLLNEISNKYYIEIHAFCLMSNHYHLLIHTPLGNLGKVMRHLDGVYTKRFNQSENIDGPLFRGRYKAILIEEDSYLLQVSRYIHLNPVEASICADPIEFEWSSLKSYINLENTYNWLITEFLLSFFKSNKDNYHNFIKEGIDVQTKDFYSKIRLPSILGKQEFIDSNVKTVSKKNRVNCAADLNRLKNLPSIITIAEIVSKYFSVELNSLKKGNKGYRNVPRSLGIYLAKQYGQLSHRKIAEFFTNITPPSIGISVKNIEVMILANPEINTHLFNLVEKIKAR